MKSYWLPISTNEAVKLHHSNDRRFYENPCFLQVRKDLITPYKACVIATGLADIPSHGIIVNPQNIN